MSEYINTELAFSTKPKTVEKVKYTGVLRIIGVVKDRADGEAIGYVIMNEKTQQFKMYTVKQTEILMQNFEFINACFKNNKVENTECSMDKLLVFDRTMHPIANFGITVLAELHEEQFNGTSGKMLGYKVMDEKGTIINLSEVELLKCIDTKRTSLINAKIVNKGNNVYVSAIKSKFPVIEVGKEDVSIAKKPTKADEWRFEKHKTKICGYLYEILIHAISKTDINYISMNTISLKTLWIYNRPDKKQSLMQEGFNIGKELDIIKTELMPKYTQDNTKTKSILEKILSNLTIDKDKVLTEDDIYKQTKNCLTKEEIFTVLAIAQLSILYAKQEDKKWMLKKLIQAIQYNVAMTSVDASRMKNTYYGKLKQSGYLIPELQYIVERAIASDEEKNRILNNQNNIFRKKEFNTESFKTAEEIAQLGFTLNYKEKGEEYTTKTGSHYKLKFVGDYLAPEDFNKYMKLSTCLGDILMIANIERFMTLGTDNILSVEEEYTKVEMLLAILAIYNPKLCRVYKTERSASVDMFNEMLPGYNFDKQIDFKLSPKLNVYYESGCNVFFKGEDETYTRTVLKQSKIINYRSLGLNRNCKHSSLNELAAIITMITSEKCTAANVEKYIGNLRAL